MEAAAAAAAAAAEEEEEEEVVVVVVVVVVMEVVAVGLLNLNQLYKLEPSTLGLWCACWRGAARAVWLLQPSAGGEAALQRRWPRAAWRPPAGSASHR